jgi:potassium efflux system protein
MLEAARGNPRVLRDPEPSLYFLSISASTFDYELRFHVRELGDRNPAVDELLTAIALSFREHGVDMAFNQLDVFVKNGEGKEIHLAQNVTQLPLALPGAPLKDQDPPLPPGSKP